MSPSVLDRLPRLIGWIVATVILLVAVLVFLRPGNLPLTAYKVSLVTLAGVVGYWLDRSLFPYARPDSFQSFQDAVLVDPADIDHVGDANVQIPVAGPQDLLFAAAMLRRAIIVGAAMLTMGMGA